MDMAILEKYRERWIALSVDGVVVADADEIDVLLNRLDEAGITGATIQRVPAANEPLFIGLR
jgi:DNA-binding LacI/PurR family transcriptional regulator